MHATVDKFSGEKLPEKNTVSVRCFKNVLTELGNSETSKKERSVLVYNIHTEAARSPSKILN